jgi:tRNA(Leu) C34 or U34 (ribose-2'-O)-methylase TrmL
MPAAVLLINPKYPHNVAQAIRACAAYGVPDLRYTGSRMDTSLRGFGRLPREERMKGYKAVKWERSFNPFADFPDYTPVAIEVRENCEMLQHFQHPEKALYVFGPEDGSLTSTTLRHCHRFVAVPTLHCLNLSMTVGTVLYDRLAKLQPDARLDMTITENRGYYEDAVTQILERA